MLGSGKCSLSESLLLKPGQRDKTHKSKMLSEKQPQRGNVAMTFQERAKAAPFCQRQNSLHIPSHMSLVVIPVNWASVFLDV